MHREILLTNSLAMESGTETLIEKAAEIWDKLIRSYKEIGSLTLLGLGNMVKYYVRCQLLTKLRKSIIL